MNYYLCVFLIFFCLFFSIKFDIGKNVDVDVDVDIDVFINRRIYAFNRGVDKSVLCPAVAINVNLMPNIFETSVNNFFKNIFECQNIVFFILSVDFNNVLNSLSRFIINTTFGFFGCLDLASKVNFIYKDIDFRIVLYKYGYMKSEYIMVPFVGPGTIKSNISLLVVHIFSPYVYFFDKFFVYCFFEIIRKKSFIIFDSEFFHTSMLDGYTFLKDIYMQNNFYFINFSDEILLEEPSD